MAWSAKLEAGGIGFHHAVKHQKTGAWIGEQSAIVGLVIERLEEIGVRGEGAVSIGLQRGRCADGLPKA